MRGSVSLAEVEGSRLVIPSSEVIADPRGNRIIVLKDGPKCTGIQRDVIGSDATGVKARPRQGSRVCRYPSPADLCEVLTRLNDSSLVSQ